MRDFILSLMTDRRTGPIYRPLTALLYAASLLYGLALVVRRILYTLRIFRSHRVPMKIVSVGNLTLGGTGKTPFVIALVDIIRKELRREPCVLIRGYGWDEQAMLKKKLDDTPILVGQDRVKQALRAVKLYGSPLGILDDGFQYWELQRDLNIVLIDSRRPFGNGHLFPRGTLRETKSALRRADVVVFSKPDPNGPGTGAYREAMKRVNAGLIFLEASHRPSHFYDWRSRKDTQLGVVSGKRVILMSSIGDPAYFEETVRGLGAEVIEHIAFGDHHEYRQQDIELVTRRCSERAFDYLITTEKDAVKLSRKSFYFERQALLTLAVTMDITAGKETLIDRLRSVLRS